MDDVSSSKMIEKNQPVFSRDVSYAVKGVAIIMMLVHHCLGFPDYWLNPMEVSPAVAQIASQFKLCVAMYAFITGYGFYFSQDGSFVNHLKKAGSFLTQYWIQLFLIFLPIAGIHFRFSARKILLNMLALHDNIILFAWYVFFHLVVLLTFPYFKRLLNRGLLWDLTIIIIGGYGCTVALYILPFGGSFRQMLIDCSVYYPALGIGWFFARYDLFDRISERIRFRIPTAICLCLAVFLLRSKLSVVKGFTFDSFYAPCLILSLSLLIIKLGRLQHILTFFGKHSLHMWLFHSIFFSYYTREIVQPLVNWTQVPVLRLLLVTGTSTAVACMIDILFCFLAARISLFKE